MFGQFGPSNLSLSLAGKGGYDLSLDAQFVISDLSSIPAVCPTPPAQSALMPN